MAERTPRSGDPAAHLPPRGRVAELSVLLFGTFAYADAVHDVLSDLARQMDLTRPTPIGEG